MILSGAIALVCVLVIVMVVLLTSGSRAVDASRDAAANSRIVRAILIDLREAQFAAQSVQLVYLLDRRRDRLPQFAYAKDQAEDSLASLGRVTEGYPELAALGAQVTSLVQEDFALMEAALRTGRRSETRDTDTDPRIRLGAVLPRLHAALNARIDVARAAEQRAQRSVEILALALAALSLIAAGLSIFALRRERDQWRLAQDAAESARASATASDLAKTRFLAAASHDMRQPLHALTLYLNAIGRRVQTDEARDIVAKAERAAHSLSGMFSTLLDLARIQAQVIKPEIEVFSLQDLLDRIVTENPGADLSAEPAPIEVRSDRGLLERLLRNLVSNALKHGGGKAHISVTTRDAFAEIAVRDEGPGIAVDDQARIFDEFVRLDGRASSEGLGLGLSIVQRIAELLDHKIGVRSAPGEGATFTVRVPIARGARSAAQNPRTLQPVSLRGVRILVLDDDPQALEAICGALTDLEAIVRACATEAEVMSALDEAFAPNLLVLDLRIDGALVGIDIANRALARLGGIVRAIIVTGDTGADTLATLRQSNHRWLIKPVDPQHLAQAAAELSGAAEATGL
ncbi:two-component hybrid sensor and regulator [alpha proteobacterium U9-1i]|nr:two-component hybrid sensor and regulator [alpha proteobacterium U9-1i]